MKSTKPETPRQRLEYLRGEIEAEYIEPGDVRLLEWAGVPEDAQ